MTDIKESATHTGSNDLPRSSTWGMPPSSKRYQAVTEIDNDYDLREALEALSGDQQRQLGGFFVESVLHLCQDPRVSKAVAMAVAPTSSPIELEDAYRAAKGYARRTYTACGTDTHWLEQADHFVAAAAAAALLPEDQCSASYNRAWKAAIHARMAKNCEMMEREEGEVDNEAQRQYRIAAAFVGD